MLWQNCCRRRGNLVISGSCSKVAGKCVSCSVGAVEDHHGEEFQLSCQFTSQSTFQPSAGVVSNASGQKEFPQRWFQAQTRATAPPRLQEPSEVFTFVGKSGKDVSL